MRRLLFSLIALFVLGPLCAQNHTVAAMEDDSIRIEQERIRQEQLAQEALLAEQEALRLQAEQEALLHKSPLDTVVVLPYISSSLLEAFRQNYPLSAMADTTRLRLMRNLPLDTRLYADSLFALVRTLPSDTSLLHAQPDFRLPILIEGNVPRDYVMRPDQNVFGQRYGYGAIRSYALERYAGRHLNRVSFLRAADGDLPTDRRLIEHQQIDASETYEIAEGLHLDNSDLNIEQVTFHADKWHRKGTSSFQMAQTALSENWYKGGDNNMTISTDDKLVFSRYDEAKVTTLDIAIELKLSGYYTKSDTVNPMRVSDNLFRIDVSYGYRMWKRWYYSAAFYAKTPVFDYHKANSTATTSTFLSPLESNLALGLDYKMSNKKVTWSLMIAPLSYDFKYVRDKRVPVKSYGIDEGDKTLHQFGSSITNKLDWKINDNVSWSSRAYCFSTYHKMLVEFENTVNIRVGRYSTARFYYYPRFDDTRDTDVEVKEMLTFGLSFVW